MCIFRSKPYRVLPLLLREIKKFSLGTASKTYATLVQELQSDYPDGRDSYVHQHVLYDRKKRQGESVSEFLQHFQSIGRLAYPDLTEDARNLILKPIFV